MATYTTLDGEVLDLSRLGPEEQVFFRRCYDLFTANAAWPEFAELVTSAENPLVRPTGGRVTRAVWEHPLFQAVRDLEDRLGIRQRTVGAEPGDVIDRDPLADDWLPLSEAAMRKQVSPMGLYKAIERGEVIAVPAKPGGTWRVVSANSLARWTPNRRRQTGRRSASPA